MTNNCAEQGDCIHDTGSIVSKQVHTDICIHTFKILSQFSMDFIISPGPISVKFDNSRLKDTISIVSKGKWPKRRTIKES